MNAPNDIELARKHLAGGIKQRLAPPTIDVQDARDGMRRCVTCEYRLDFKSRQGNAPVLDGGANTEHD